MFGLRVEPVRGVLLSESALLLPRATVAGTVHHVVWALGPDDHEAWRERVLRGGGRLSI